MLYFSYFYLFGDVWLNYSIVSYEEYFADNGPVISAIGEWAVPTSNSVPLLTGPYC